MSIAMGRMKPEIIGGGLLECGGGVYKAKKKKMEEVVVEEDWCSSSSTSSIGKNSDLSGRSTEEDEESEVQSCYKGPPSSLLMESLEETLPIRRGISKFYNGKSKSYTSLVEASDASSIKDIAKQENAYTRRRRNLLAVTHAWDKNRSCSNISKRPISCSRSTLALAVAMSSSESISSTSEDSNSSPSSRSPPRLPPLHPQSKSRPASAWRSYSVADLQQHCTAETTTAKLTITTSLYDDTKDL